MADRISEYTQKITNDERVLNELNATLKRGAVNSGETEDSEDSLNEWFSNRFEPNSIILDKDDYSKALIRSLWIAPNLAALDFSGGRLRDFAQLWTDTARGFLGEIAVQKFLKQNFNFDTYIETRRGKVEEFMPSDISIIEEGATKPRMSQIKVSIKTTKFNGRWLEIPESQFKQSDIFVLIKLGISRFHFSSYLKSLETIKQIFETGIKLKELNDEQIRILSKEIPDWLPIPAYICGFVAKNGLNIPIDSLDFKTPRKRKKDANGIRPISCVDIQGGVGLFSYETIKQLPEIEALHLSQDIPINIAGIGKEVDGNFYASSGRLKFSKKDWAELIVTKL